MEIHCHGKSFVWVDSNNNETSIGVNNTTCSINENFGNYEHDPNFGTTYESEFIDLLNAHSIYIY